MGRDRSGIRPHGRKVRAPQNMMPGNPRAPFGVTESAAENIPPVPDGSGKGEMVG